MNYRHGFMDKKILHTSSSLIIIIITHLVKRHLSTAKKAINLRRGPHVHLFPSLCHPTFAVWHCIAVDDFSIVGTVWRGADHKAVSASFRPIKPPAGTPTSLGRRSPKPGTPPPPISRSKHWSPTSVADNLPQERRGRLDTVALLLLPSSPLQPSEPPEFRDSWKGDCHSVVYVDQ